MASSSNTNTSGEYAQVPVIVSSSNTRNPGGYAEIPVIVSSSNTKNPGEYAKDPVIVSSSNTSYPGSGDNAHGSSAPTDTQSDTDFASAIQAHFKQVCMDIALIRHVRNRCAGGIDDILKMDDVLDDCVGRAANRQLAAELYTTDVAYHNLPSQKEEDSLRLRTWQALDGVIAFFMLNEGAIELHRGTVADLVAKLREIRQMMWRNDAREQEKGARRYDF